MPSADDPTDASEAAELRYVATFDPDAGERASEAIVTAVAALTGDATVELSPLYEAVEPDSLDSLVRHARRSDDAGVHQLWFTYEGFDIGVQSNGEIRIRRGPVAAEP
ncbi:HalOD1 output domain-containing protein [Natronorubrum sp. DTA7]|uniref:HalOD1 output domain-containing protein n=1 Tax=Natronorubrum sp. DTA7 TaxID=3447016 RepID=UPI003F87EE5F